MIKILFLSGSAEPGKDGVGDYSRRLCGALVRLGHEAQMLSLCDHQATAFVSEQQWVEGTAVTVNRIPKASTQAQRLVWTQQLVDSFEPNWISLQFVPYSFNPKGLPFWLPNFLKKINGKHQWHIMFHELWLGIDIESSFKHKCIGKLQQFIVKNMVDAIKPQCCQTQNQLYQFFLKLHTIDASILPICSNIPVVASKNEFKDRVQFVLFGTIHPGAPFEDFVKDLLAIKGSFTKPIEFVLIGKNGYELLNYTNILAKYAVNYNVLGIQTESQISEVLINSDFGISTTPYFQTEKSGVYAAYREHGLNTITVSRDWTPSKGSYQILGVIRYEKRKLELKNLNIEIFNLNCLTKQFVNTLS